MPTAANAVPSIDAMPAALPSMWRAVKRGFVAEPALIVIAFALSLFGGAAGRADAAVAEVPSGRLAGRDACACLRCRRWAGGVRDAHLGAARGQRPHAAALSRSPWPSPWSRTSRSCKPPSPPWSITNGPTISTASPSCATKSSCSTTCTWRCSAPAAGSYAWESPSRCWSRCIRRWRSWPPSRCRPWPPRRGARPWNGLPNRAGAQSERFGATPVRLGHHRAARQGSASGGHRHALDPRSPRRLGSVVRRSLAGALGQRRMAHARLGGVRGRLCGRGGFRCLFPRVLAGRHAIGAGGGFSSIRLHQRHCRRDRFPARHLDGRLQTHGLAGGLRRREGRARRPANAPHH